MCYMVLFICGIFVCVVCLNTYFSFTFMCSPFFFFCSTLSSISASFWDVHWSRCLDPCEWPELQWVHEGDDLILPRKQSFIGLLPSFSSHVFLPPLPQCFLRLGWGGDTDLPLRPEHSAVLPHQTNENYCQL